MESGFPLADIIIIGAIAVFIILRYRSILGQKTGFDVTSKPRETYQAEKQDRVIQLPRKDAAKKPASEDKAEDASVFGNELEEHSATIARIKAHAPEFRLSEFLEGSKAAFEMVIDAFNSDDRDTLKMLLSKDLYKEFEGELKNYDSADSRPFTTLVAIENAVIENVELKKSVARITVGYASEQIHVEKDAEGKVVSGNASQVDMIEDEWVFEKDMRSKDPNWTIIDT